MYQFYIANKQIITKILLYVVSVITVLYFFPSQTKFKYDLKKGAIWNYENLYSPFDFPISKTEDEINQEKKNIELNSTIYFDFIDEVKSDVFKDYENKFDNYFYVDIVTSERSLYFDYGLKILNEIYNNGVVSNESIVNSNNKISIIKNNFENEIDSNQLFYKENLSKYLQKRLNELELEKLFEFYLNLFLEIVKPNLLLNQNFSEKFLNDSFSNISPTRGLVLSGSLIISQGEIIEGEKYLKLISLKKEYESNTVNSKNKFLVIFGYALLVIILFLLLFLFIKKYYKTIFDNNKELTFVLFNIVLMIVITTGILNFDIKYVYASPICILPLIVKSFFDARLGLFTHFVTILLLGFIVPNSFEYIFLQSLVGVVAVLSVSDLYIRANLFISVFQIVLVYVLSYMSFHIIQEGNFSEISFLTVGLFVINGLATLFVQPLLYLYEKIFNLVSDVSLLELSDTNSKLLRDLSDKAPGTFNHSIQVANLAEAAASEINANVLLIRVGALYHDIGKIKNPLFFSENQLSENSPHDRIGPEKSAQIILNHVKDGVEIAKKSKIPSRIIDFIITHHGTSRVYYFFKKAVEKNKPFDESKYKYEGPKPFSKETAILMMADSVEAASKSIKNPSIEYLTTFVNDIIDNQLIDKQFSDSNISLVEIEKVKNVFVNKLINVYNLRVEYPK